MFCPNAKYKLNMPTKGEGVRQASGNGNGNGGWANQLGNWDTGNWVCGLAQFAVETLDKARNMHGRVQCSPRPIPEYTEYIHIHTYTANVHTRIHHMYVWHWSPSSQDCSVGNMMTYRVIVQTAGNPLINFVHSKAPSFCTRSFESDCRIPFRYIAVCNKNIYCNNI